jgi:hypothetical protein
MAGPGGETHRHRHLRLIGFAKELNPSDGRGLIIRWPPGSRPGVPFTPANI